MPDAKLTDLSVVTEPLPGDLFYIVNNNLSKSTTLSSIALNLPSVVSSGNANLSGDLVLSPSSNILFNNVDYSAYVYDQISTNFMANTGTEVSVIPGFSDYTVLSSEGNKTIGLSGVTSGSDDRILVKVAGGNYSGFNISFIQLDTATIEVSAGNGVTIGSLNGSLSSAGQYAKIDLTYVDNQLYTLTGDLSAKY